MLSEAKKGPRPNDIKPMLATLVDAPFNDPEWIFEIKWDGYRAVSYLNGNKVEIRSRNNLSFNSKFKEVVASLQSWNINAVVDGEIIAMDEGGHANFQQLQGFVKNGGQADLVYYVFDILWYEGKMLTKFPLSTRKRILEIISPPDVSIIRFSDHITAEGKKFFQVALSKGLEGIMAKKMDSEYVTGFRTRNWLKIKNNQALEAIICGFTEPRNSRKFFGAVILGKYFGKELKYIGHSGSGFDDKGLKDLYKKFQPLTTDQSPFKTIPKTNAPVTWLIPKLVCEVKFSEWTSDKILRHPIFMGLRDDKSAETEKNEKIVRPPQKRNEKKEIMTAKTISAKRKTSSDKKPEVQKTKKGNGLLLKPGERDVKIDIEGRELKFTNLDKLYWPKEKITKRDMLNYYDQVMPYIIPYMKDRPQSLNRHPNGINGPNFYQKNVEGKVGDWIVTHPYKSESDGETKQFLVCSGAASLMYIANLGCIEMNPWHSRIQSPDNPDWCVIDLDPDGNPFDQVIEVALTVKKVLDEVDITGYCKTSGATGMHIYIPLGASYSYDQSRMLAELIVQLTHHRISSFTSLERNPAKRKKKIYLDYLQNRSIQTIAAPYSLRPKPGATASTPLHWEELKKGLTPSLFTINTIFSRLKKEGDLFKPVLGKGINVAQKLKKISDLLESESK